MSSHPLFKAYLALASVCFFWGTTYLGIRMALESFPPLLLVSARFLASGLLMVALVRWRRMQLPTGMELAKSAFNGFLILGVGNSCLTYSERLIPSSLAALFIAVSPFWLVGLEAAIPGGDRLRAPTIGGMLTGFAGAGILFLPNLIERGMQGAVWQGFLLLQLGSATWSLGSILQRRQSGRIHPIANGAVQQLAAGVAFLLPALTEIGQPIHWSERGVLAWCWLVVFGSIVGYSCYIYALEKLPVAMTSVYTYVNPLVAAFFGWVFYREPFGAREAAAMAVIFGGVAMVKVFTGKPKHI